jgi:hypothetical protein
MMKMHDEFLKMVKTQDTELASQVEKMKNPPLDQKAPHIVETNLHAELQIQGGSPASKIKASQRIKPPRYPMRGGFFLINLTPSGQALSEADTRRPFPSWLPDAENGASWHAIRDALQGCFSHRTFCPQ